MASLFLRPTANGDLQEIPNQYPGTGAHWDKVDEETPDDGGTNVYNSYYAWYRDLYVLNNPSAEGTINWIRVKNRCKRDTGGGKSKTLIKTHGTLYEGVEESFAQAWESFYTQYDTNPYTSAAWTWQELNDLQAGLNLNSYNSPSRCTWIEVEVNYTEPTYNPPTVQTEEADEIQTYQATLNGYLADDGGLPCDVAFDYGETDSYGESTEWQTGKTSPVYFDAVIADLLADTTYHFRAKAKNTEGTTYVSDKQFKTLESPKPPKKIAITHPALKRVRVIKEGQVTADYDKLSDLSKGYIENGLELPVVVPAIVEVETLAGQVYTFTVI